MTRNITPCFQLVERIDSISKEKDTAAGNDEIHYQLLKHLPRESLKLLLKIFNDIWLSGEVPDCWKDALVIPRPKPGKDHTNPNKRLIWYLESQGIITNFRSTNDHLVRL